VAGAEFIDADALALGRRALAAWSRFTVTRDLRVVEDLFAPEGPQYQAFRDQARAGTRDVPPPGYRLGLGAVEVLSVGDGERILRGAVVAVAPEGHEQRFHWDITLRRDAARGWQVWSVRRTPRV
jgi:hypothetical protein